MDAELDPRKLILIVVGAALRAEQTDRPVAYALRQDIQKLLERVAPPARANGAPAAFIPAPPGRRPVVCSDVWYLNHGDLRDVPVISIGPPPINALSAFLASRLPAVFRVDDRYTVQMDLELRDLAVCCWGLEPGDTASAVGTFRERYLEMFLPSAAR